MERLQSSGRTNAITNLYAKKLSVGRWFVAAQRVIFTLPQADLIARNLKQRGGALITTGSIASQMPARLLSSSTASKHKVEGYIGSLRPGRSGWH